jgi:hypothetical protein
MTLTDEQIDVFVAKVLHLGPGKKKEYLNQVDHLIEKLRKKIENDSSFKVKHFKKTGSLVKGTVLRPRDGFGVDADIAVALDVSESEKDHIENLHQIIRNLVDAVYPSKPSMDFWVQPRTLGIHFRESGLDVDLVPVIPIVGEPGYSWQPSSNGGDPVKTNIQAQLNFIKSRRDADPRFKTLVRLIKRWRNVQELEKFRSYTIELIVSHLYDTKGAATSLESGLKRFFLYVAQSELRVPISFPELGTVTSFPPNPVVILDPVNKANNVAMRLTDDERKEVVSSAQIAWERITTGQFASSKGDTLDLWKEVFGRSFTVDED